MSTTQEGSSSAGLSEQTIDRHGFLRLAAAGAVGLYLSRDEARAAETEATPTAIIERTDQELSKLMAEIGLLYHAGNLAAYAGKQIEGDGRKYDVTRMLQPVHGPGVQTTYNRLTFLAAPGSPLPNYTYIDYNLPKIDSPVMSSNYNVLTRYINDYTIIRSSGGQPSAYLLNAKGAFELKAQSDKVHIKEVKTNTHDVMMYFDEAATMAADIVAPPAATPKAPATKSKNTTTVFKA